MKAILLVFNTHNLNFSVVNETPSKEKFWLSISHDEAKRLMKAMGLIGQRGVMGTDKVSKPGAIVTEGNVYWELN